MTKLQRLGQVRLQMEELLEESRLRETGGFIQHGDTTVLLHCLAVAYFSLRLSGALKLNLDRRSLIRGALLHDYFLYDWHIPDPDRPLHGFIHAEIALRNAERDLHLTDRERDIILHHMFPLNLSPPRSREAWLICLVDKGCSLYETLGRRTYPVLRPFLAETVRREE